MNDQIVQETPAVAADDPELLCYCKSWTRSRFSDYARERPEASFDEVCLETGVGMVCTSCLLNAELVFTDARRAGPLHAGKAATQGRRQRLRLPSKGQIIDWLVRQSPLVPGRFESVSPIIAAPGLTTLLHVS